MILIKIKKAFTLIELMISISIIGIILLSTTSIDYNRLSQTQQLEIFTNNIKSNFEKIRNNSLSWKWIWVNLDIPKRWKIDYWNTGSWIIQISTYNWTIWSPNESIDFDNIFYISQIKCWEINELPSNYDQLDANWTWTIIFEWLNIKLDINWDLNCNQDRDKILEIYIKSVVEAKRIKINTLNGLVETK